MSAPQLPQELLEKLFELLDNEQTSLRACALVHRSWTPSSQARLFRVVGVRLPSFWPRLCRLLEDSPHIRPFVLHLLLHAPFPEGPYAPPHPGLFPRVAKLTYVGMDFNTATLDCLPALKSLEFMGVMNVFASSQTPESLALRSLEKLTIHERLIEPILHWIGRTGCTESLRELEVSVPEIDPAPALRTFRSVLQSMRGLRKLKLNIEDRRVSDLALGEIRTPRLVVHIFPDHEALPLLITLLNKTAFVGLRQLDILIDVRGMNWGAARADDNGAVFDPFVFSNAPYAVPDEGLSLDPALAGQLEKVTIAFPRIRTFYHVSRFLATFGNANRPGVLRLLPSTLILNDGPLPSAYHERRVAAAPAAVPLE
jgi:hypothetical protein